MKREWKSSVRPSIFTSRNNATIKLFDEYVSCTITAEESRRYGHSRDKDGKLWTLNSIKAVESGEWLRPPTLS